MTFINKKIAEVVVGLPVEGPFDYFVGENIREDIAVGKRVLISFNRRKKIGFVIGLKEKSEFENLNTIMKVLDNTPALNENALLLTKEMSKYYGCSHGEVIETYLPPYLRKNKEFQDEIVVEINSKSEVSSKRELVVDKTVHRRWEYIIAAINKVLAVKRSIIFLVPEVQMIANVMNKLKNEAHCQIFSLKKKLKPAEEFEQWVNIKNQENCIVIGTRSTVFTPVNNLGLIIVYDQENDSYKQEQVPHYNANHVASMRCQIECADLMYVSAAPLAELWQEAQTASLEKVVLDAEGQSDVQFVDMTNYNPQKTSLISAPLQNTMLQMLGENKKIVILMNRRGFWTFTQCNQCGYVVKCERCDVNLAFMQTKNVMVCSRCNFQREVPKICPGCNGSYLRSSGTGIEKLEEQISKYYMQAFIGKYDKDTKKFPVKADIVIATQAILKMKDIMQFDMVAVINFDSLLSHVDFRSSNKAFSLLASLKQMAKEKLLIQTRMPDNYCLKAVKEQSLDRFYKEELQFRKELNFPPYSHLVSIVLRGTDEEIVIEQSQKLYDLLNEMNSEKSDEIEILDIHPDSSAKLRDKYRFAVVVKGKDVETMQQFIKKTLKKFRKKKGIILTVNVD